MSKIKLLIVEDNIIEASKLECALEKMGYESIIVDNAREGITCFYATDPDIVILDIALSGNENGIELAGKINADKKSAKPIIFLTASDDKETFLKAKKTTPAAFLIKPFDNISLQYAIELALEDFSKRNINMDFNQSIILKDNIFIKKNKRIIKVPLDDIIYIEVQSKYSEVYTNKEKFLLRISLNELSNILSSFFVRIHRNYMVNINKIRELNLEDDTVIVEDKLLAMGKSYKKNFTETINYLK